MKNAISPLDCQTIYVLCSFILYKLYIYSERTHKLRVTNTAVWWGGGHSEEFLFW